MKRKPSNNKSGKIALIIATAVILVLFTAIYLSGKSKISLISDLPEGVIRSKVVNKYDDTALDGPSGYKLESGHSVQTSCGFCPKIYEGKVIGDPRPGDKVEVKANKTEGSDLGLVLDTPDTYIKEL